MPLVRRADIRPSVEPNALPFPYQTDRGATADAFGADVGRAVTGLGQAIEGASNTAGNIALRQMADDNERVAKELDNTFSQSRDQLGHGEGGLYTLKGSNAVNSSAAYRQSLTKLREDTLSQAPNSAVRRMLEPVLNERLTTEFKVSDRYVNKERETAAITASAARVNEAVDYAAAAWDNPEVLAQQEALIRSEVLDQARQQGLEPEAAQSAMEDAVTDMYYQAIVASMKTGGTAQAKELLTQYSGKMDAPEQAKLQKIITDADSVAADRAESRAYRDTVRAERLERIARNEASAALHQRIFQGEELATLAVQEPELFAMVSGDGGIMASLRRSEEATAEGRNYATHTDPEMQSLIFGLPDSALLEFNDDEARMVLDKQDYQKYLTMKRGAQEANDTDGATFALYNHAENTLKDKAPLDLEWGSSKQNEENRKTQQTITNEMNSYIANYTQTYGKPPTPEQIQQQADLLLTPIVRREQTTMSYIMSFFRDDADAAGYAAQLRTMTPEQRAEVRIPIEDVNVDTVSQVKSLFAQNGQPLPSSELIEEYLGAALTRDYRRMQELLGLPSTPE